MNLHIDDLDLDFSADTEPLRKFWRHCKDEIFEWCFKEDANGGAILLGQDFVNLWERSQKKQAKFSLLLTKFRQFNQKNQYVAYSAFLGPYLLDVLSERSRAQQMANIDKLLLISLFEQELSIPQKFAPTGEDLINSKKDDNFEIPSNISAIFPFVRAYALLYFYKFKRKNVYLKHLDKLLEPAKEIINATNISLGQAIGYILRPLLVLNRNYKNDWRVLKRAFRDLPDYQDHPKIVSFLDLPFCEAIDKDDSYLVSLGNTLRDLIKGMCKDNFNAAALITELGRIRPPLSSNDFNIARNEIERIAAGDYEESESPLLRHILPAIRGDAPFDLREYDDLEDRHGIFGYTSFLIRKLQSGHYNLEPLSEEPGDLSGKIPPVASVRDTEHLGLGTSPDSSPNRRDAFIVDQEEAVESEPVPDTPVTEPFPSVESAQPNDEAEAEVPEKIRDCFLPSPDENFGENDNKALDVETHSDEASSVLHQDKVESDKTGDPDNFTAILSEELPAADEDTDHSDFPDQTRHPLFLMDGQNESSEHDASKKPECMSEPIHTFVDLFRALKKLPVPAGSEIDSDILRNNFYLALENRDYGLLYCLAKNWGDESPVPGWLARLLGLGMNYLSGPSSSLVELEDLFSEASEKMDALDKNGKLLLGAALLLPALLSPRKSMHTIISSLAHHLSSVLLTPFFRDLENFILRGVSVDKNLLIGPNERRQLELKKNNILNEITEFISRMKQLKKTTYEPATKVRRDIFSERGEGGMALNACLVNNHEEVRSFLGKYKDVRDKEIDRLIDCCIKKYSNKRLISKPRAQLQEDLRYALDLCSKWLAIADSDIPVTASHAENEYHRVFCNLPDDFGPLRETAEGKLLADHLDNLRACPKKKLPVSMPAINLDLWHLRLPGSDASGRVSLCELIDAVTRRTCVEDGQIAASLVSHMAKGDMLEVEAYMKANPAFENVIPDFSAFPVLFENNKIENLSECLKNANSIWKGDFEVALGEIKTEIMDAEFRGAILNHQQVEYNARVSQLEKRVQDGLSTVEGWRELMVLRTELSAEESIVRDQLASRLSELEHNDNLSHAAKEALSRANEYLNVGMINLSNTILEDITDNLNTGKDLGSYDPITQNEDVACKFYNEFLPLQKSHTFLRDNELEKVRILLKKPSAPRLVADLKKLLTSILSRLGFNINQEPEETEKLRSHTIFPGAWRKYVSTNMEVAGPLPQWGIANKRHIVYAGVEIRPENIRSLFEREDFEKNTCTTIICCNAFSRPEREKIISHCAEKGVAPLVVDDNLLCFLAMHGSDSLKSLFDICLAGADIIPYTDVAGAVPKEMFFGREHDIEEILEKNGPCIIYGGRQLGKSAILRQIYNRKYPDVKVLLHSMNNNETSMLEEIRSACVDAGIIQNAVTLKSLSSNIEKWLNTNPGQRILMLLDECDRVLDRDRDNNFAEITELRSLMEKTGRRFKIVLTGLHSVQRFETIANQPFLHFGTAMCVGPLPAKPASDLVTVPMGTLGVRFESPQLVQLILYHCGYQPKLIQVFCSELLKAFRDKKRRGPFRKIDNQTISEIYKSHNLREVIKKCFNMTLNMDDRYLVIGYVLAAHKNDNLSLRELLEYLRLYWPAAFTSNRESRAGDMLNNVESLLHEMMGLGLVSKLNDHFRLRTPNVIELLGGEETIHEKLADYETRPYEPTGNPDKIRIDGTEVMVASQYNLLSEKANNFLWITGSPALGIERVPEILEKIKRPGIKVFHIEDTSPDGMLRQVRQFYEDMSSGGIICWFSAEEFPYVEVLMEKAIPWLTKLRASRKFIKIVALVDPYSTFMMYKSGSARKYSTYHLQLLPWSVEGVKEWCKEKNLSRLDPGEIIQKSSGWHKLVYNCLKDEPPSDLALADVLGTGQTPFANVLQLIKRIGDSLPIEDLNSTSAELFELFAQSHPGKLAGESEMAAALETLLTIGALREIDGSMLIDPLVSSLVN